MANAYTAIIEPEAKTFAWRELHTAKFAYDAPFQLQLHNGEILFAEKVLRLIPKRRMVVYGKWQNKTVVAKLFFDTYHAKRHLEEDLAGIKTLIDCKIPTPQLYFHGVSMDRRIHIIIVEHIADASTLDNIWLTQKNSPPMLTILKTAIIELATQHVVGVLQHDLHLKNFLLAENLDLLHTKGTMYAVYTLDGAQVELFKEKINKKESMDNLALFLSQLGIGQENLQKQLFECYAQSRGWLIKPEDYHAITMNIKKWNILRWKRFERKIFRESTDFSVLRSWNLVGMYDRHYTGAEFQQFLKHPDLIFQNPQAIILKDGNSSTVIRIKMDGHDLVIKRYNIKNIWHRCRRFWRTTRACLSWRLAHKLRLFGIRTAKPVAFLEYRFFGFHDKSYFVTPYISGEHAGEYLSKHLNEQTCMQEMTEQLTNLLKNLAKLDVTHGDLKITNVLIDADNLPVLIDLDGAVEHLTFSSLQSAWRKEWARFLRNFEHQPSILHLLKNFNETKVIN